ncbi:hypothetical protein A2635_03575 [Candidatus Peribacteria bacterium RIFCSPHIGHO2_01_FULL_51_9]|nr:MAG: hypothetical protein A2635_03575 [Candidatus Peribacteria bacterium RIFCSPHIGHO2_01_FULL_51_9]
MSSRRKYAVISLLLAAVAGAYIFAIWHWRTVTRIEDDPHNVTNVESDSRKELINAQKVFRELSSRAELLQAAKDALSRDPALTKDEKFLRNYLIIVRAYNKEMRQWRLVLERDIPPDELEKLPSQF